jgi:4-hydroxybenzoate polyprenyltransferase
MVLTKYALINSFFLKPYLSYLEFLILTLSVLLITAGGYIINDIYDIKTDLINKPNKVFVNKTISKKNAWIYYFLFTFLGLLLGLYLSINTQNSHFFLLFLTTSTILFLYSLFFKKMFFIGNLIVSILISLSIFIILLFDIPYFAELRQVDKYSFSNVLNCFLFFAFLTTFIREMIKDIEDIDGDKKVNAKTLPIIIGRKRASKIVFFFTSIFLVFFLNILQFLKTEILFLSYGIVFILLPLLYFMFLLWKAETKKDFSKLSSTMKIIMFFGILSMLLFKI